MGKFMKCSIMKIGMIRKNKSSIHRLKNLDHYQTRKNETKKTILHTNSP